SVTIWKVKELKLARNNISNMILLDIGDRKEFSAGHIPNAKNIPLDELDARALEELSDSKLIVIYSHDEGEWQSKIAAKIIASKGFNKTVILSGGFVSWTNEDLPRAVKEMTKYNSLR
ncbi:MAG: rhodanese-like domain-containing protein, partial [Blastocatellia bacterium]